MTNQTDLDRYDSLPYSITLTPESDGTFIAMHLDLPGCVAQGGTAAEAVEELQEARRLWLESNLRRRLPIPEPRAEDSFSGKVLLRMTSELHAASVERAQRMGVSLNHFIVSALSQRIGYTMAISEMASVAEDLKSYVKQALEALLSTPNR